MAGIGCGCPATKWGIMSDDLKNLKTELRREIRARLKAMTPEERAAGSEAIRAQLQAEPRWRSARGVMAYVPTAFEPDVWPLIQECLAAGRQVALLRYVPDGDLYVPCHVRNLERDLQVGQYGIPEPGPHCPIFDLMRLDLALVPGIGFSLNGGRLGRGKGYYDRLLAEVPALKCGVAFDRQIVDEFPLEPHDIRLNCILTPSRWHWVPNGGRS